MPVAEMVLTPNSGMTGNLFWAIDSGSITCSLHASYWAQNMSISLDKNTNTAHSNKTVCTISCIVSAEFDSINDARACKPVLAEPIWGFLKFTPGQRSTEMRLSCFRSAQNSAPIDEHFPLLRATGIIESIVRWSEYDLRCISSRGCMYDLS